MTLDRETILQSWDKNGVLTDPSDYLRSLLWITSYVPNGINLDIFPLFFQAVS